MKRGEAPAQSNRSEESEFINEYLVRCDGSEEREEREQSPSEVD